MTNDYYKNVIYNNNFNCSDVEWHIDNCIRELPNEGEDASESIKKAKVLSEFIIYLNWYFKED